MNLNEAQALIAVWNARNFPRSENGIHALLGVCEEAGELCHAHLKQVQGIRGTEEQHELAAQDAVGDIVIYLLDYCEQRGWNFEHIVAKTVKEVIKRDWRKNKEDGT